MLKMTGKILTNSCSLLGLVSLDSHSIPLGQILLSLKEFLRKQSHYNNKQVYLLTPINRAMLLHKTNHIALPIE